MKNHSDVYVEVMKELIKHRPEIGEMLDKEAKSELMRAILKQNIKRRKES